MSNYLLIPGTSDRHNDIIGSFVGEIYPFRKNREVHVLSENCLLSYFGNKNELMVELIDVTKIPNIEKFIDLEINDLGCVEPDFMLFQTNPYVKNKNRTRTAGQPDLIIEVWSPGNTFSHREFKKYLYSTSVVTEHWYIEQESNRVECYIGKTQLNDQSLANILITQKDFKFDLRYLSI